MTNPDNSMWATAFRWNADQKDRGTVTAKNWAGVTVKWDNRNEQAILHNNMARVERVPTKLM